MGPGKRSCELPPPPTAPKRARGSIVLDVESIDVAKARVAEMAASEAKLKEKMAATMALRDAYKLLAKA
eukprot:CAMPEP_0204177982 /NCGR_PEP_ID=MMETSP0361-20130328/48933_1 /ASSEMBLY_ACC=CAM_ASM_000343 /TAXON_ID=268821 /ORGANISM="Scrippsiella Hangoei, Strain SHTV-5" /LENGTH=68 /DNA_ID=CAMNT_0051137043 /DNA_START=16 /DNA_END=219 /DNA_ORIENTATION=-